MSEAIGKQPTDPNAGTGTPLLEGCLEGNPEATRALIEYLAPVIRSTVVRAIVRKRQYRARGSCIESEIEDLTQEVFLVLFADASRILRTWDPRRGYSLTNFVGLVARRKIANIFRSGRRCPWNQHRTEEEPTDEQIGIVPPPDAKLAARELLASVIAGLRQRLSPQAFELFELLLLEDCPVDDACFVLGMNRDAVYAWRSRLPRIARRIAQQISAD